MIFGLMPKNYIKVRKKNLVKTLVFVQSMYIQQQKNVVDTKIIKIVGERQSAEILAGNKNQIDAMY